MNEQLSHPRATLLVIAVFLLGIGLGVVGSYGVMKKTFAASRWGQNDAQKRAQWVEHLTKEVGMTPDQRKQLDKILTQLQERYKAIHEQQAPQIDQARQDARNQIRAILTPDQIPKLNDFFRRLDEERAKKVRH
jgi:Spy/CpxP family protein refolding chaperone